MQRIIDNVLYDTEVSECIFCDEEYRRRWFMTSNNRFFIVYATGEMVVTTEEAVKEVLGRYDIQKYIEIFGEPEEG